MRRLAITSFSLMLALAAPAVAQTGQQTIDEPQDKCSMQPEKDAKEQPASATLTEKLGDCGGVLKPPPTGDQGMAAPAPDEGNTPVIKPGEVPQQPPKP
ncbi:hypothetical protein EN829_020160 [Mesorhizobium sp. M00.F.Ca.ET.186.01.1.1]|nr:hypothetical protein EN848_29195 [bacterium M00.F.Ca.ET.205.01.1.1]TGU50348.1 hypothetical protein EN795_22205 [bacterium M00.F.Ca.ET.152.01.1.1]TGV33824.1 hypothetical protein EN829_020160 [Mesorhizobium sp. M00.F.Ca.ET.186.01.1.1]TGZ40712.1 hypothetical protein EN805_21600 [bacterium M00.F.Ca.ET.162.01.1.1]